jgi:hypothetical protein
MLRQSIQWHAEDNVVISVSRERAQVHKKTLTGSKTDILHGACGMNENNDLISDHVPLPQMPAGPIAEVHRENWQRKTRTDNAEETRQIHPVRRSIQNVFSEPDQLHDLHQSPNTVK